MFATLQTTGCVKKEQHQTGFVVKLLIKYCGKNRLAKGKAPCTYRVPTMACVLKRLREM